MVVNVGGWLGAVVKTTGLVKTKLTAVKIKDKTVKTKLTFTTLVGKASEGPSLGKRLFSLSVLTFDLVRTLDLFYLNVIFLVLFTFWCCPLSWKSLSFGGWVRGRRKWC